MGLICKIRNELFMNKIPTFEAHKHKSELNNFGIKVIFINYPLYEPSNDKLSRYRKI